MLLIDLYCALVEMYRRRESSEQTEQLAGSEPRVPEPTSRLVDPQSHLEFGRDWILSHGMRQISGQRAWTCLEVPSLEISIANKVE